MLQLNNMLTKNQTKLVKSLQNKKHRDELGLFLVEGEKSVLEVLKSDFQIDFIVGTKEFFEKNKKTINNIRYEIIGQDELEKVSTLMTNDSAVAVVKQSPKPNLEIKNNEIIIALDKIQDPGNLGTIIRTADWYGIKNIVVSEDTADFYNPKVIASSMGSFTRTKVFYRNLESFLTEAKVENISIIGAYLDGEDIHKIIFPPRGVLLMGNESKGISKNLEKFVSKKVSIPSFGKAESLNVAVATSIILDNWKRNIRLL